MPDIPEQSLADLRNKGLVAIRVFGPDHKAYPNGCWVGKPIDVSGTSHLGIERPIIQYFDEPGRIVDGPITNAPVLTLYSLDEKYVVELHDCIPGPGPGDFMNEWATIDDA